MNNALTTFDHHADRIAAAMANLAKSVVEAGRLLVAALEQFPDAISRLVKRFAEVPPRVWAMLEKVGRGVIDGRLALGCPHASALQRLPLSEQRRALDDTLDLALPDGDSCKVKLQDATPEQARQLIGLAGIRSIEQQAAWMRERPRVPKAARAPLSYELRPKRGEVVFSARGPSSLVLSKGDLLDLLRRLG